MKQVFLVLVMLCCAFVDAQNNSTISGAVTNIYDKTPIPNCVVNLKIDSIVTILTKTDSLGNYKFELKNPCFKKATVFLTTDKNLKTPTAKCAFFATDDVGSIVIQKDSIYSIIKNFQLTPVNHCEGWTPRFYFKKRSICFDTIYGFIYEDIDSSYYIPKVGFEKTAELLNKNPSIIIQFDCHCSSEEGSTSYADKLSIQRAEKVKEQLVQQGVDEKRIIIKAWGERKLLISDQQIHEVKTKEEKEALHSLNRRCVFRILSWDFQEEPKPPIKKEGEQENLLPVKPD